MYILRVGNLWNREKKHSCMYCVCDIMWGIVRVRKGPENWMLYNYEQQKVLEWLDVSKIIIISCYYIQQFAHIHIHSMCVCELLCSEHFKNAEYSVVWCEKTKKPFYNKYIATGSITFYIQCAIADTMDYYI